MLSYLKVDVRNGQKDEVLREIACDLKGVSAALEGPETPAELADLAGELLALIAAAMEEVVA